MACGSCGKSKINRGRNIVSSSTKPLYDVEKIKNADKGKSITGGKSKTQTRAELLAFLRKKRNQ